MLSAIINEDQITFLKDWDLCVLKQRFGFLIIIDNNIIITLEENINIYKVSLTFRDHIYISYSVYTTVQKCRDGKILQCF